MNLNALCVFFSRPRDLILKWRETRTSKSRNSSGLTRSKAVKIAFLTVQIVCLVVLVLLLWTDKSGKMSKLSFRARALDATKPMPVYRSEEVPDLPDFAAINRAVPQMPTGMEKEEECEHHLQRAISAQQAFGHTGELVIPTPEVYTANEEDYENIYPGNYKMPRQLIHMQPFAMDQDIPDYDMDSEDEKWINQQARKMEITSLQFEEIMDRLEKSSGQQVVTLKEAKLLLKEDDDLIIAVYDYWLNKRLKTQHPLIPTVKTEKRDGSTNNNPYVAFRRRTEKMQTRKNRKNDEASYEKMLKLRRDLSRAVTLLEMVKRREKTKREHLHLTIEIFEKRHQAGDFSGQILAEVSALKHARSNFLPVNNNNNQTVKTEVRCTAKSKEVVPHQKKRQYTKRKNKQEITPQTHIPPRVEPDLTLSDLLSSDEEALSPPTSPSDQEDENDPDGQFAFRRKKFCNYHAPLVGKIGNWPWCGPEEGGSGDKRYRYCLTSMALPRPRCIGFTRRRIGRGGRVLLDRAFTPLDDHWSELDLSSVSHSHSLPNGLISSNDFISEVKNEWLHFRPQMSHPFESTDNLLEPEEEDEPELSGFSIAGTSTSFISGSAGHNSSSSHFLGTKETSERIQSSPPPIPQIPSTQQQQTTPLEFNLESFQSHQEELFEMQRKQLERLKADTLQIGVMASNSTTVQKQQEQVQRNVVPSVTMDHSFALQPSSRFTLDSASAQFAVSTVVSPSEVTGFFNSLASTTTATGISSTTGAGAQQLRNTSSHVPMLIRSSSGVSFDSGNSITSLAAAKTAERTNVLSNGPTGESGVVPRTVTWQTKGSSDSEIFPLMMSPDSLIEITLPDGSVTSGHVHIAPSETQMDGNDGLTTVLPSSLELASTKSLMPVQHGLRLQQPNREQNGSEKSQEEFSLSKVKLETVQPDCGFPMDVT